MRRGCWLNIFTMYVLFQLCSADDSINLQCRDNYNKPADWWYIYKPPSRSTIFMDAGSNFSFIWSGDSTGRWRHAAKPINSDSMLKHTVWPMYRNTYKGRLAVMSYTESKGKMGTSAMGLLMVDDSGKGLWLGHTVPGYPDPSAKQPVIPPEEMSKGHMLLCISLQLESVNAFAKVLDAVAPAVTELRLPTAMAPMLPAWEMLQLKLPTPGTKWIYGSTIHSRHGKKFTVMARIPGDKRCLYEAFAKSRKIVLDVYSSREDGVSTTICVYSSYGVRNIKSISLKYPEEQQVNYIHGGVDRARFAVSTAAHWQTKGRANNSYWVCVSNLDKEDTRNAPGGLLMCVEDFGIWRAFDNMKVSEPKCD